MKTFDITEYLVEPDIAKWAKERGFSDECARSCLHSYLTYKQQKRAKIECVNLPTFQQVFDWCEDKWGISLTMINKMGKDANSNNNIH